MGGNALKNCVTRRYDADEYNSISHEVVEKLSAFFKGTGFTPKVNAILAYKSKESFGDLDILIESTNLPNDWHIKVAELFDTKEYVKNSNVLSFEYKEFQIDLIATPDDQYLTSCFYFAYNDLGNLLGRIAHSMGLKLGHDGLSYNWRIETYQFKNEIISTDWKEICNVLGVSYDRYCQGFDKLEDIFKFVVASPFFHKDIYLLENRNNYARTRDKKRKTYTEFLDWIEGCTHTDAQQNRRDFIKSVAYKKDNWLPYLFNEIKGFEEAYNRVQAEWAEEVEFKSRYNGDVVREITGISGKSLGLFMKWMKETHNQEHMRKDILKFNREVIPRWIKYWFDQWFKTGAKISACDVVCG